MPLKMANACIVAFLQAGWIGLAIKKDTLKATAFRAARIVIPQEWTTLLMRRCLYSEKRYAK